MTTDTTFTEPDISKLDKIRALLDKAESTATMFPAEAEALTAKAIELMERYRIDEAMIQDAAPLQDRGKIVEVEFSVGAGPYVNARVQLAYEVAKAHSVKTLISNDYAGKTVYLIGYETDVFVTEMLYTSLLVQATKALKSQDVKSKKRTFEHGRTFTLSFLISFASRIGERLREANKVVSDDVDSTSDGQSKRSVALVLADRSDDVEAEVMRRYGKVPPARPHSGGKSYNGYVAGRVAADGADLSMDRRITNNKTTRGEITNGC